MSKKINLSYNELLKKLQNKEYFPVYILDGEEVYFTDTIIKTMEDTLLPEEEKDFNLNILYGKEIIVSQVIEQARQYPMFGEKQVIILKDASEVKNLNELVSYIQQPMQSTILVLDFKGKKLDKRTQLAKIKNSNCAFFTAEKIKDYEVPQWIENYSKSKNLNFSKEAISLIHIYLGNNLNKIVNEISKFEINYKNKENLDLAIVSEVIGMNKEYQVFDFPDMIFQQNSTEIARMLNYFLANPKDAAGPFIVGVFYNFISKVLLSYYVPGGDFAQDRRLGIWSKHRQIAQRVPIHKTIKALEALQDYSKKVVGIDSYASDSEELKFFTGHLNTLMRK